MTKSRFLILGIDASNLRSGGGVTHLVEFLSALNPSLHEFKHVVIWAGKSTLELIEDRDWLLKLNPSALNWGLLQRTFWQRYCLSPAARSMDCDLLFIPGGNYLGNFYPTVTMSRNLLPFEPIEYNRYLMTVFGFKLLLLRWMQLKSFKKADGTIFLTTYARDTILKISGKLPNQCRIIPHGISSRFNIAPKFQRNICYYNEETPYRVIYVSTIDLYKHQWHVVEAISILRKRGLPIVLDLVGSAYSPALKRLKKIMSNLDPAGDWAHYHGVIAFDRLHQMYHQADLGLFASSCENMPNILLELMLSGLPIVCSSKGPMKEILGNSGQYIDPENPIDIAKKISDFIESPSLRLEMANASYARAQQYSWNRCVAETFFFFRQLL